MTEPNGTGQQEYNAIGFAIAASTSLFAVLLWVAPEYLDFSGRAAWVCYGLGLLFLSFSAFFAVMELSSFFGSSVFIGFALGLFFLVPAATLHFAASSELFGPQAAWWAKLAALVCDGIGGFLVFVGMSDVIGALVNRSATPKENRPTGRVAAILTLLSFASTILPIIGFAISALTGGPGEPSN